jgi:hypothetical protein
MRLVAPASDRPAVLPWLQAVLVTLLTWAALLCTGLSGTVGVMSQTLAGKLAASAQHLQRHAGTSLATRAARGQAPAVLTAHRLAQEHQLVAPERADLAGVPPADATPRAWTVAAASALGLEQDAPPQPALRAHRSRAPPSRA